MLVQEMNEVKIEGKVKHTKINRAQRNQGQGWRPLPPPPGSQEAKRGPKGGKPEVGEAAGG